MLIFAGESHLLQKVNSEQSEMSTVPNEGRNGKRKVEISSYFSIS